MQELYISRILPTIFALIKILKGELVRLFSKIFIFFCMLLLCVETMAQESKAYFKNNLDSFSFGKTLIVNGKEFKRGFLISGKYDIAETMKDNSQAFEFAKKHETYAEWGGIAIWSSVGIAMIFSVTVKKENYRYGTFIATLGAGLISSLTLQHFSSVYLNKAINTYNGVDPNYTPRLNFSVTPIINGGFFCMNFNFR